MTLEPGEEESLSVASYFIDQDGDVLTYTASSATESAATVSMDGSRLTVTAVAGGRIPGHGHGRRPPLEKAIGRNSK